MITREGLLDTLLAAGARLMENACGFCIGNSASPGSDAVSLRTSNRNFFGRSGTPSAQVYLVSPETAAVAALCGAFKLGSDIEGLDCPVVEQPARFDVDDRLFLAPADDPDAVEIVRGPNIGTVPLSDPLPEELQGVVAIKVGDKITTDHIMPAGQRLKYRSNVERYSQFVFENEDPDFAVRAAANRDKGLANVIVAGDSYGQGSSREHAALCPMYLGVRAVVAKSIERIHHANLVNFGIIPFVFEQEDDYDRILAGDALHIDDLRAAVGGDGRAVLVDEHSGTEIRIRVDVSDRQRGMLLAGGLLNQVRESSGAGGS